MNRNGSQIKILPKINRQKQDAHFPSRAHPNKPSWPSKFGLINDDHGCMWWRTVDLEWAGKPSTGVSMIEYKRRCLRRASGKNVASRDLQV